MPLIVFNFTSATELTQTFNSQLILRSMPANAANFTLKQVSAQSSQAFASGFRYIEILLPDIMTDNDRTLFASYTITNGVSTAITTPPALRYYLTDNTTTPFAIHHFPNLYLGRHHLHSPYFKLQLSARQANGSLAPLSSYSVVLEYEEN
jgi:hypothetical protein